LRQLWQEARSEQEQAILQSLSRSSEGAGSGAEEAMNLALEIQCQLWVRRFQSRYGYLPTIIWVDGFWWAEMYAEVVRFPYYMPAGVKGITCYGIPVYQR